jgi:type 1 glutamine amidotransferase
MMARAGSLAWSAMVALSILVGLAYERANAPAVGAPPATQAQPTPPAAPQAILVFSKTAGFRHESIPAGIEAIKRLGDTGEFRVDATEDANAFTDDNLSRYAAVVFLNTTGDVLDEHQQRAFERFIRSGRGFVGVHAASDTEYDWPWYGHLVGAYFSGHPAIQPATIRVVDRQHASTRHLPEQWQRTDEWYNFRAPPAKDVSVLAVLDESSYEGGTMSGSHPIAWCHQFEGGRAWYTGGGHTVESYAEQQFMNHLLGGIRWAMKPDPQQ